jgi:hypothetical protein
LLSNVSNRILAAPLFLAALWAASCAAPLGPGYTVERQGVAVGFVPGTEPRIEIQAEYRLRNTGKQSLDSLDVRLPRGSKFRLEGVAAKWDGQAGVFETHSDPAGDVLHFKLSAPWPVKRTHTLHLEYSIVSGGSEMPQLDVAPDGFYLLISGWLALPLPPEGTFGSGGAPPKEWILTVRVPADFLVRASGKLKHADRRKRRGGIEFTQQARSVAPYVVAGRYFEQEYGGAPCPVHVWRKKKFDKSEAEALADSVHKITETYETMFGPRDNTPRSIWIMESPTPVKRLAVSGPTAMGEAEGFPLAPPDIAFISLSESGNPVSLPETTLTDIAESLARTWSGLGMNRGYDKLPEPLKSLPSYAAIIAEEAINGPQVRTQTIQQDLKQYDSKHTAADVAEPQEGSKKELGVFTDGFAHPFKTRLFYFAMEDQFGRENLHKALRYMVQARKGGGYSLDDMIAALDAQTHQNAAAFVRLWRKHHGIPGEFRARYTGQPAPAATLTKEMKP